MRSSISAASCTFWVSASLPCLKHYPFVPYQFPLFQSAIRGISLHNGFEGKANSVGERSMLGVFRDVAIAINETPVGQLATFDRMFEGIRGALKSAIQSAVNTAERNLGDPYAVSVLKALFLVKYVKEFKAIGWLYQFYISEKKDAVFEGLKKNEKITPANIPAATQLFTPHWIVRYLVDNSLGRLWLLNRPSSKLAEQMAYYIAPEKDETDFLKISKPEDIKVCDPACGSGHMLTYAFDLPYAIYEEEGYDSAEIPEEILTHNLYGIELDERAGELAAFALTMKARARQRRFFNKRVKPNITVLEKVSFSREELDEYMGHVGRDLFTHGLRETLQQFSEADNFGSLINPKVGHVADVLATLEAKDMASNLFLAETHRRVLRVLRMAEALSPRYAVVVANPPYMGGKGMNGSLSTWAKETYPNSKSDLFAMFIERNLDLAVKAGTSACSINNAT